VVNPAYLLVSKPTWDVMDLKRGRNARCDGAVTPSRSEGLGFYLHCHVHGAIFNIRLTVDPRLTAANVVSGSHRLQPAGMRKYRSF